MSSLWIREAILAPLDDLPDLSTNNSSQWSLNLIEGWRSHPTQRPTRSRLMG